MRHFVLGFLINYAALISVAMADISIRFDQSLTYAVPKKSPVTFASKDEFTTATFTGRFKLSGRYFYNRVAPVSNEDIVDSGVRLYFVPDKRQRLNLPYWSQRGHAKELWFSNSDEFIHDVIPTSLVAKVGTTGQVVSARATILVDGYQASVECDTPTYTVRFVSTYNVLPGHLSKSEMPPDGC